MDFDLDHLEGLVAKKDELYRTFRIPKKNGKMRVIQAPVDELKELHTNILKNVMNKEKFPNYVTAFTGERNLITNVTPHQLQKWLIKIDIHNFFPSIPIRWVKDYFIEKLGDIEESTSKYRIRASASIGTKVAECLAQLCTIKGRLTQGFPTSPMLSNICLKDMDKELKELADEYKLSFTRYADDIALSGDLSTAWKTVMKSRYRQEMTYKSLKWVKYNISALKRRELLREFRETKRQIIRKAYNIIRKHGFTPNRKKTVIMPFYKRQVLTGLLVNNAEPAVTRKRYMAMRAEMFNLALKKRLTGYNNDIPRDTKGRLSFIKGVNPKQADKVLEMIAKAVKVNAKIARKEVRKLKKQNEENMKTGKGPIVIGVAMGDGRIRSLA